MNQGDTLLVCKPGDSLDNHLWVVLSNPDTFPDEIVLVNFTSLNDRSDRACVLEVGDHPFIRHSTCIFYKECKVWNRFDLEAMLSCGLMKRLAPVAGEVFQRILDGVNESLMPLEYVDILVAQGLVEDLDADE